MNDTFSAVTNAVKTLKSELSDDQFEFRYSDLAPNIEVVDLNCEEEHEDLDKIYMIVCYLEDHSFGLHFESSLAYKSTFSREHAAKLINEDIDFEIYKGRLKLSKKDITLEDLAAYVKIMSEILFNF